MDSRCCLELKIMHCRGLQAFNFFQKLLVYVLVSISSDDPHKEWKQTQPQRTPTDKEGDSDPEWNHPIPFDLSQLSFLDCDHLLVYFDIRHEGLYFGDKTIGEVRVPLKDLLQGTTGIARFVNYEIRTPDGKPNGVLNFSYTVKGKVKDMGSDEPGITGYSIVHQTNQIQYPAVEAQTANSGGLYPSLDLEETHYPPPVRPYASQENAYPYPPQEPYYPPLQPPPAPMVYGACCYPPQPPVPRAWLSGVYDYSRNGNWSPPTSQAYSFHGTEMWANDFQDGKQSYPCFLNER